MYRMWIFKILTAVLIKIQVLWYVTMRSVFKCLTLQCCQLLITNNYYNSVSYIHCIYIYIYIYIYII
jgi:hypothetical protein